jgi:outer membrane protein TolC
MMKPVLILAASALMFLMGISSAQPAALLGATSPAHSAPVDSLTVEQAVRLALENHPLVAQAEYGVAATDARIAVSRSPWYPDISFLGLYTLLEPVPKIDMAQLGSFQLYPENNYDFHLGLRQTLYDFGRISTSVRVAESARRSAEDYADVVKSNLAYQTIAVFDAMLILHQTLYVLDEQIDALEQHLEISTKKIEAGTATNFDSLTTAVRIAVARNERIDAARALEAQEIAFRQLTGLPPDRSINPKGAISAHSVALSADSVLAVAKRQRPELVLSKDAENGAAIQAQLASLGDKPSLAFNMTSGFKNGYVPDLNKLKANIAAGVQLQFPIFDGHRTRYREKEADANVRSAKAHTADIERQVMSEVEQAMAGVKSSRDKIENSAMQVRQAEAALSMAKAQYEAGTATNMDLLDVQTSLSQAKLIRLRAIYDYMVSLNALDRATGKKVW